MKRLTLALVLSAMIGCAPSLRIEPKADPEHCPAACANLRLLGCEEANDLYDSERDQFVSCETFCLDTTERGFPLNTYCLAHVQSCDEVSRLCER